MISALRGEVLDAGDVALARVLLGVEAELLATDDPNAIGADVVPLAARRGTR